MLFRLVTRYNTTSLRVRETTRPTLSNYLTWASFLPHYYRINDLIWQDGLLIDFLQNNVADKWVRRFLVYSSYLFSERVLFEFVVRFYIDFIVWPLTVASTFEFSNVAMTLAGLILSIVALLLLFNLSYLYATLL